MRSRPTADLGTAALSRQSHLWRGEDKGQRGRPRKDTGPGIPKIATLYEDLKAAGIARVDGRNRHADFHPYRYFFCKTVGQQLPIQKVKLLMRHLTLQMTADLYGDLEIKDVAEEVWTLPPLFERSQENASQQAPAIFPTAGPTGAQDAA